MYVYGKGSNRQKETEAEKEQRAAATRGTEERMDFWEGAGASGLHTVHVQNSVKIYETHLDGSWRWSYEISAERAFLVITM